MRKAHDVSFSYSLSYDTFGTVDTVDLLIEKAYLLTMDPDCGDVEKGYIAIKDGCIVAVGEESVRHRITAKKTIDASGCVVMPGLINTHSHLAMTLFRGIADDIPLQTWLADRIWPAESSINASDVHLASLAGCLEMIRSGTTAFADMYFHMDATAEAVKKMGLRAHLAYGMIDLDDKEKLETEIAEAKRFTQKWKNHGHISTMYGPHSPITCSENLLRKVARQSKEDAVALHTHILETEDERETLMKQYGKSPIQYLEDIDFLGSKVLAAHCVWLSDEDINILARHDVKVSHNAVSNMKLASGIAPVAKMLEAGITVSLGSDGCASNNNLDLFEEMKIAALLQKVSTGNPEVLPAQELLGMATINGAKSLGINSGMLRPGKNADVIIVDMSAPHLTPVFDVSSHLVYSASGADVLTTIVGGKVLMENRHICVCDEDSILERMRAYSKVSF